MSTWKNLPASNRQQKVLRFFKIPFAPDITKGVATRYIMGIFITLENRERWNKYAFLTNDFDDDTAALKPFDPAEIDRFTLPANWEQKVSTGRKGSFAARAEAIWAEASPFDDPEPPIGFPGKHFCFTGKFEFGSRKACQAAIEKLGGVTDPDVNHGTDFLVIGKLGSDRFANEGYGRKIEWAIVAKFEKGNPILISEDHWVASCGNVA